ncbi:hypothetical protein F8M41_010183 [Gigaspora margarita]|uniref:Peptidase S1 domain-containing protein n=1 Tax=Gigaspora margarita TaxID=4874 RepID=A0A8H4AUI6_GIGMA|nr:hypothetical protein F8M41_010183 [Gigaspora margarita]
MVKYRYNNIRTFHILAGKESYETVCEGDSGGPAFSYLQVLSTVSLIGIIIVKVQDLNEFIPLDVILNKNGLELPRVVRNN